MGGLVPTAKMSASQPLSSGGSEDEKMARCWIMGHECVMPKVNMAQ